MNKEGIEATLKIPVTSIEQRNHIQRAQSELLKAAVTFDSGYDLRKNIFDWELDWSLKGAKLSKERELVFDSKRIEKSKYIMNAEDELRQGEVYFDSRLDEEEIIVWELKNLSGAKLMIRNSSKEGK